MKKSILVGALIVSSLSFGQKKNETSAAVEYLRFQPAFSKQDYATAQTAILNAKGFIDLAAEHPDTKESPKTLYYKGLIYFSATQLADEMGDATFLAENFGEKYAVYATSVENLTKSYNSSKKYQGEVDDAAHNAQIRLDKKANEAYNAEDFKTAAELYDWRAKFMMSTGVLDSGAVFSSGLCAEKAENYDFAAKNYLMLAEAGYRGATSYNLASGAFRKAGNIEKAKEVIAEGRSKFPNDRDLLLELVNINIEANDPAGAEAALNAAIAADPNNKQLFYTIGTIYIEMKENAKAEKSLLKALEIDPNYVDAQYQLGAHLVSWAGDLKTTASNLKLGDAQYDVLLAQSTETYQRAVAPLEKYIATNPTDAPVLNILYQLHKALGNSEKANEYKKRYQEAK